MPYDLMNVDVSSCISSKSRDNFFFRFSCVINLRCRSWQTIKCNLFRSDFYIRLIDLCWSFFSVRCLTSSFDWEKINERISLVVRFCLTCQQYIEEEKRQFLRENQKIDESFHISIIDTLVLCYWYKGGDLSYCRWWEVSLFIHDFVIMLTSNS